MKVRLIMKEIIIELLEEFHEFFDPECEYGIGYLDALTEVCQKANIPHERLIDDLIIE